MWTLRSKSLIPILKAFPLLWWLSWQPSEGSRCLYIMYSLTGVKIFATETSVCMCRGHCHSCIRAVTLMSDGHPASVCLSFNLYTMKYNFFVPSPISTLFYSFIFLFLFSVSEIYTNPILKFWHCLANSCYLAERPVIFSKCLLLLINSCNYREESWVVVCENHSSGLQLHSWASPSPITKPHTLSNDLYSNSKCCRFCKFRHLIVSASVTDQLEAAV